MKTYDELFDEKDEIILDDVMSRLTKAAEELKKDPEYLALKFKAKFAYMVSDAMKSKGINKSELSRMLNKSRQYINKILNESSNFTIKSIAEICTVLDIELIFDTPENYLKCDVYYSSKPSLKAECEKIFDTDEYSSSVKKGAFQLMDIRKLSVA